MSNIKLRKPIHFFIIKLINLTPNYKKFKKWFEKLIKILKVMKKIIISITGARGMNTK